MARFVRGDVVVVPFPFSSEQDFKRRPAVVLTRVAFGAEVDYVLCMITAQNTPDPWMIPLEPSDILDGSLTKASFVRPAYLFTVGEGRILKRIGKLRPERLDSVLAKVHEVFA